MGIGAKATAVASAVAHGPNQKHHLLRLWINADNVLVDEGNVVRALPTRKGAVSDVKFLTNN